MNPMNFVSEGGEGVTLETKTDSISHPLTKGGEFIEPEEDARFPVSSNLKQESSSCCFA